LQRPFVRACSMWPKRRGSISTRCWCALRWNASPTE
jgi:hypothetical protein